MEAINDLVNEFLNTYDGQSIFAFALIIIFGFALLRALARARSHHRARKIVRNAYQQQLEAGGVAEGLVPYGKQGGVPATRQRGNVPVEVQHEAGIPAIPEHSVNRAMRALEGSDSWYDQVVESWNAMFRLGRESKVIRAATHLQHDMTRAVKARTGYEDAVGDYELQPKRHKVKSMDLDADLEESRTRKWKAQQIRKGRGGRNPEGNEEDFWGNEEE